MSKCHFLPFKLKIKVVIRVYLIHFKKKSYKLNVFFLLVLLFIMLKIAPTLGISEAVSRGLKRQKRENRCKRQFAKRGQHSWKSILQTPASPSGRQCCRWSKDDGWHLRSDPGCFCVSICTWAFTQLSAVGWSDSEESRTPSRHVDRYVI